MKKSNNKFNKEMILIYLGVFDLVAIILNSVYHFNTHEIYNTLFGKILIVIFLISLVIIIVFGNSKNGNIQDIVTFVLAVSSISIVVLLLGILIYSVIVSRPLFLLIQWLLLPFIIIMICLEEGL